MDNQLPNGRLFVVAGANHLDPDMNKKFQKMVDQGDEIILLKTTSKPIVWEFN